MISLRARILILVVGLSLSALFLGVSEVWYGETTNALFQEVLDRETAGLTGAMELETSLALQKGYATYYFLDQDERWLKALDERERAFIYWLHSLVAQNPDPKPASLLREIQTAYIHYTSLKRQVIDHYREGAKGRGQVQHQEARREFDRLLALCDQYKLYMKNRIAEAREAAGVRAARLRATTSVILVAGLILTGVLIWVIMTRVLGPIRRMAAGVGSPGGPILADEVKALSDRVDSLLDAVDRKENELVLSREHLAQAEKMATLGKLAASMAHSIRNPLTSVKMRLFTLERTLEMNPSQQDDLTVIADEIRHIDSILGHFLEFARPPKLKPARVSPSHVVDTAVELLRHRLEGYGVAVEVVREGSLPEVNLDSELVKEVLVNLMVNACEAMPAGGRITISEESGKVMPLGAVAVIRVADTGPGVPEHLQKEVFEPFFSTKEEGTGLGLPIARRIVEEHGGWLTLASRPGQGAVFTLTLPCGG